MEDVQPILFWIVALLTGLCAIAVVVSQNIVRSATWLLFTLAGTSGIFFLLGADLVAAIQLLVYVGGTLVLVVFGVMLTAQGPFVNMKTSGAEWAISALAGILLLAVLGVSILSIDKDRKFASPDISEAPATASYSTTIGEGFLGVGVGPDHKEMVQGKLTIVRANYLLAFEIVSVHLLVVLIGAAYLARAKRRRSVAS